MAKRGIGSAPLSRFGVLVAQLESVAASARQKPPDPLLCFDLLSELVAAIEEEPKESIVQWQRKCEEALYSFLTLGARRPVRRLASLAMGRVISKGDSISIYSRASSLQGWLVDAKRSEPFSCSGAAHCLGELYRLFGRRITSGLTETTNIASKLMKFHEDFVRQDALQMLENALEGSGGSGASTAYSEAFRIITRVGVSDKSFIVRLAAARCLRTFASIGGPGLGMTEYESSILYCIKALEDPVSSVRDAFAEALGALLALAMNPEAQVKQKGKNHSVPAKKLEDGLQKHLISPFIRASGIRAKDLRIGLALSWVFFLQVIRLKYHFLDIELQNFAVQAMDMLQENVSMDAHTVACVLYIIRVGVVDQMIEPTQRSFLVLLGRKLESAGYTPSMGVATLRILSYLLKTLGEVPGEFKDVLDNTVVAALSHSSLHVRTEAALTVRALAEVDPTCVGGLISYGVTTLHALRENASIEKGPHLSLELDSLHGQATVVAALVFISPKLLLGYPARLPKSVFAVSKKMLTGFSRNPVTATVEKEAGWLLLASLITSMPKMELEDQVFDVLLLWADPFVGNPESHVGKTQDLTSEIRVLSAAIEALTAFIRSYVSPTVAANNGGIFLQPVLAYLSGALSYIESLTATATDNVKSALDLFTIRTLMAYQSISNPAAYKSEHPQIIQICTAPFSDPSRSEESSCLRFLLDKRDACLGPWIPGRDWFEDELRAFDGGKDGLMPCVWEDELSSFPQPECLSKMLVDQKLLCLGTIFASQDNSGKMVLLNKIDQCLKAGKKQSWHVVSVSNTCVALLAGLKAMLNIRSESLGNEILSSIQSIFQAILAEGDICPAQRRASSEGLGLLARLGNDIFTARMTRTLLGELVASTDPSYIGSIALSLGCIHRSAGGMALSTLVPASVSSISALARASNAGLQLWSLHALLLTIEAAGLSYVSQVPATLFLAMEILLSEENGLADIRQEIGRLINAIVAVLGPELSPGSTFFSRCKSVIAEISSCQETSTLLESVRFTQQLVLFAPQAVSVHSYVQSLLPTLTSRQPSLRYLAVSTLRHLIEKYPVSMVEEHIEESLFCMLDEETDAEIGRLVRTTITRLLHTSCPLFPSRWLAVLHNMVLASSARRNTAEKYGSSENNRINGISEGDAGLYHGDDDEDMIANPSGEQIHGSNSISVVNSKREKHLRYRTRVFAAECLSHLPTAVGTEPAHFDLSLAKQQPADSTGDWLVLHLQELVSLSYQISTGQFEGMQTIGVRLLSIIMDKFEKTPDPELPGHLLLEQYQAQLVSAVRSAISMSSGPLLLEAGLQLATQILTSSIISGDRVALSRMFSLISRPLNDIKNLYYPSFAEWVACKIKIRLLAAHASIKCYVYQFLEEQNRIPDEYLQLTPLFSSSSSILGKYWISILKDYIYISFGLHSKSSYMPFLDGIQSPLVSSKVQSYLDEVWMLILRATALDAIPVEFEQDGSKLNVEDLPKTSFLSGYSMVRLELHEFQFLWGLTLLILFQAQQPVVGTQVKRLLVNRKKKNDEDSLLEETYDATSTEIALTVVKSLSKERFFCQEFLALDLCMELLQVLQYTDNMRDSWNSLFICLLSQIVNCCPNAYFEADEFTSSVTELCFKYLFITLQSNNALPEDDARSKNLFYELSMVAQTIAYRMNKKNQWKLIMAFISTSCEWVQRASTSICLSKVFTFLQTIMPFLKRYLKDEAEHNMNDYTHLKTILGAWCMMLACLTEDCIKRMHNLGTNTSNSSKLLVKLLAFCLEEAADLARLVHETQLFRQKEEDHMLSFAMFKHCARCIRDALDDTNLQVKTVGLLVLKSVAQRELVEGSHVKNHSFFLFFIGEFFEDIFLLIQHTLKESNSKESIAAIEECLRLLFLIHTLSQQSDYLQAVLMLLLEALLMVFSVSNENISQEIGDVKTIIRRMVSHIVQIPSSAIQIKEVLLSMPMTRRQKIQDMIRASVDQGQTTMQVKFNVQPETTTAGVGQASSSRAIVVTDEHDIKEDLDQDDEDDWDAFQSLPATDASDPVMSMISTRESDIGSEATSVADSSNMESDSNYGKDTPKASEIATYTQNMDSSVDREMVNLDRKEVKYPSDPQWLDSCKTTENKGSRDELELSGHYQQTDGSKELTNESFADETLKERTLKCKSYISHPSSDDNELFKAHSEGVHGEITRSEGDDSSFHEHSGYVLASSHAKEINDQHLHCEEGTKFEREDDQDGFSNLNEDAHSAPKENVKDGDRDSSHKHSDDKSSASQDREERSGENISHKQVSSPGKETNDQNLSCEGGNKFESDCDQDGINKRNKDVDSAPEKNGKDSDKDYSHKHSDDVMSASEDREEGSGESVSHEQEDVFLAPKNIEEERAEDGSQEHQSGES